MYFKKEDQELLAKRFGYNKYLGRFDFIRVESKTLTEFPAHILAKGEGDDREFLAYWTEYDTNKNLVEFTEFFSPHNYNPEQWKTFNERLTYVCESCHSEVNSGFIRHFASCKCHKITVSNRGLNPKADVIAEGKYKIITRELIEA